MPVKNGFSIGYRFSTNSQQYFVRLWRQPLHRWLIARLYHRYDMAVFRFPGFRRLERWLCNRSTDWTYLPISCRQDIRCFFLMDKERTTLAEFEISQELVEQLNGRL